MQPESFFDVAIKVPDIEESLAFYRDHFDADLIERGHAADGEGATALDHVALEVAFFLAPAGARVELIEHRG